MDWQPFYTVDQLWAQVDVAEMSEAMREAYEGRAQPPGAIEARFATLLERVGDAARTALEAL
jgi:hypothetical protein